MNYSESKKQISRKPEDFIYYIELDERGSFLADVRNEAGETVFTIKAGNELGDDETSIFDDGFMRHEHDMAGLSEYLVDLGIMRPCDHLFDGE